MEPQLQVKLFFPDAQAPSRATEGAAGYDIYSYEDVIIEPMECAKIETGVGVTVPHGTYGRIAPRSGLACKKLFVNGGVIDEDFTSNLKVIMQNMGKEPYKVTKGDRIAQLILEKIVIADIVVVPELKPTTRGTGGFGSTGK